MKPYYEGGGVTLHHGDCLDVLAELPDASVHSVVCDPPYGLGFMGREWDRIQAEHRPPSAAGLDSPLARMTTGKGPAAVAFDGEAFQRWCQQWAAECLRVLKPGGHLLSFGGTRTWHRLACAVEDAGFEIRDSIAWLYASGFPKSLDVSKAIDKAAGAEREVVGPGKYANRGRTTDNRVYGEATPSTGEVVTLPASEESAKWQGWGTALKPAHEPILVARKPLTGTVAANVLEHGTGALNIDGCRVGESGGTAKGNPPKGESTGIYGHGINGACDIVDLGTGRWPANVVLDESQAAALDEQSGTSTSRIGKPRGADHGDGWGMTATGAEYDDQGGASRFYFIAKETTCGPSSIDTDTRGASSPQLSEDGASTSAPTAGIETLDSRFYFIAKAPTDERPRVNGTAHPTVKPLDLMRWLVRLVTPPGGTVLEPFAGSGTTVEAALLEGFACIAIEREAEYLPLIEARIARRRDPVKALELAGEDGGLFDLLDDDGDAA